jgi:hypothetical protein
MPSIEENVLSLYLFSILKTASASEAVMIPEN